MSTEVASAPLAAAPLTSYAHLMSSPQIDARLNLSLDDLIKERKKENKKEIKQKKRDNVKQDTAKATKGEQQQKKKAQSANVQADKRKAVVNKNRGLPNVPQQQTKQKQAKMANATNSAAAAGAGQSARALKRKKAKLAAAKATGRKVVSPKAGNAMKQQRQPQSQQARKGGKENSGNNFNFGGRKVNNKPQHGKQQQPQKQNKHQQRQPSLSPKRPVMKVTFTSAFKQGRDAPKAKKGAKLQITLTRSKTDLRRVNHKQLKPQAARAMLPGKSQPKTTKKMLAQKLVKSAKASRKQSSKSGKFVVRKPVVARKIRK